MISCSEEEEIAGIFAEKAHRNFYINLNKGVKFIFWSRVIIVKHLLYNHHAYFSCLNEKRTRL